MGSKDLFSSHSKIYAAFRPTYPDELYTFIFSRVKKFNTAWDCATGNGQVAAHLAKHFDHVYATDLSKEQIAEAQPAPNISYSVARAEHAPFDADMFDLITVGQALHWIDTSLFYEEVKRTGNERGVIAVWGYALLNINAEIDKHFQRFYRDEVGSYWDAARRLVEQEYEPVPFPFYNIEQRKFSIVVEWSAEQFAGYLTSWSATQKFIKANGFNPVDRFMKSISSLWPASEVKTVRFPVFVKVGDIHSVKS